MPHRPQRRWQRDTSPISTVESPIAAVFAVPNSGAFGGIIADLMGGSSSSACMLLICR